MRLFKLLVAFALFFSLAVTAFAHPGKTDSKGGHTDHSTGEYHYHHGYSAHQHYDQDGDGILDCPYQFIDKTDSSSDSATHSTSPSTESFEDMVAKYKREQDKSNSLPTVTEPSEETTNFSEIAKTALDYAGKVIIILLELSVIFGFAWGLVELIKSIFQK